MTESRLWILGASDPEMEAIENLLRECGEHVVYATDPVHVGDATPTAIPHAGSPART